MSATRSDHWIPSSKGNPCPICGRTKDGGCSIRADGNLLSCHRGQTHQPPDLKPGEVVDDWAYTGESSDGRCAMFTPHKPRDENTGKVITPPPRRAPAQPAQPTPAPIIGPIHLARLPEAREAAESPFQYSETQYTQRVQQGTEKVFIPQHRQATGEWAKGAGPDPWPLWREAEALDHGRGHWLLEAEGEKCAEIARTAALVAISQPGHAHKPQQIELRYQRSKAAGIHGIVFLQDNDQQGEKRAQEAARAAAVVGLPLLILPAITVWPGLPTGGSIDDAPGTPTDWIGDIEAAIATQLEQQEPDPTAALEQQDPVGGPLLIAGGLGGLLSTIPSGWVPSADGAPKKSPLDAGALAAKLKKQAPSLTRFNDLSRRIEFNGEPIQEDEASVFYVKLQEHGYKITEKHTIDGILDVAYDGRFHPVRDYLDVVATAEDTTPADLGRIATTYLSTSDPLYDAMLRKTLIGAVARIYEPGCQFDSVCVLRGKQGIRKSTFWKMLASPSWFTCTAPDNDKDLVLNIHAGWLFELAELETVTSKRDVGQLRNLITTSVDLFRVPYGKTTAPHPRRSIFVGSVNGETFLNDQEGSRRFWVIECPQDFSRGELIDVERVRLDRDAIWKAAVLAYRNGEKPYLDQADQVVSNKRNGTYEQEHPWTAQLDAWVARRGLEPFTTAEALNGSNCRVEGSVGRKEEMEGAAVLKKLGIQRQVNASGGPGGRARRWFVLTQPTQPDTTSNAKVVSPKTPVPAVDLGGLTQPTQPFSQKSCGVKQGGSQEGGREEIAEFAEKVVQVVSWGADPLPCNGFTPTQPAPAEVVSGAKVVPVSVSIHHKKPAWLPHLLALKAEHPDHLPAQFANELMARHGVMTSGRTVRGLLERSATSAPAASPAPSTPPRQTA